MRWPKIWRFSGRVLSSWNVWEEWIEQVNNPTCEFAGQNVGSLFLRDHFATAPKTVAMVQPPHSHCLAFLSFPFPSFFYLPFLFLFVFFHPPSCSRNWRWQNKQNTQTFFFFLLLSLFIVILFGTSSNEQTDIPADIVGEPCLFSRLCKNGKSKRTADLYIFSSFIRFMNAHIRKSAIPAKIEKTKKGRADTARATHPPKSTTSGCRQWSIKWMKECLIDGFSSLAHEHFKGSSNVLPSSTPLPPWR